MIFPVSKLKMQPYLPKRILRAGQGLVTLIVIQHPRLTKREGLSTGVLYSLWSTFKYELSSISITKN